MKMRPIPVPPGYSPEQARRHRMFVIRQDLVQDCGAPVSKYATRCREHSEIRRRKLTTAAQRTKRLQERLSA